MRLVAARVADRAGIVFEISKSNRQKLKLVADPSHRLNPT
jgi:hypothetical protein